MSMHYIRRAIIWFCDPSCSFRLPAGFVIPIAVLFVISFPPVRSYSASYSPQQGTDVAYSSLVMKSLRFCADWFGGYGQALASFVAGRSSEKLETSSLCHRPLRFPHADVLQCL